jgi:cytosine/adenosine deaminase-related metal-dependent hydrolase
LVERVLRARAVLPRPGAWIEDGGVVIAGGRVARLLGSARAVARAARGRRVVDLGDVLLAPGLVDPHAHLELSGLAGAIPPAGEFVAWVGELLRLRAARPPARLAEDAARGARLLLAAGVTTVGDVDTTGAGERGIARSPLRAVVFREALDAHDPARTPAALERLRRPFPRRARQRLGLAPHAPFSASPALLGAIARLSARRALPLSVHWSETEDEVRWLERGEGPLVPFLGTSPRERGLVLLERAGLLCPRLLLVHGNHPGRGELERIAAAGATLVHCPGTHAFFGRGAAPVARWRRAGVRLSLGTDSLASNGALDLRREMRLFLAAHPAVSPAEAWEMGTTAAAEALGLAGRVGEIVPGAHADLVAYGPFEPSVRRSGGRRALEALISGLGVVGVWVGGRKVGFAAAPRHRGRR